jgi:hypothetical protein
LVYPFSCIATCADEKDWWYFELLDTLRRMLLTGGLILAGAGTVGQIIAGTLVSLLFLLLTTRVTPFVSDLDDALSFVCNLQQVLLYVVGLGLKTQEAGGTGKGTYSSVMFVSIVNGLTISVVAIGVLTILSIPCSARFEKWLKKCHRCCGGGGRNSSGSHGAKRSKKRNLQKILPSDELPTADSVRNWSDDDRMKTAENLREIRLENGAASKEYQEALEISQSE